MSEQQKQRYVHRQGADLLDGIITTPPEELKESSNKVTYCRFSVRVPFSTREAIGDSRYSDSWSEFYSVSCFLGKYDDFTRVQAALAKGTAIRCQGTRGAYIQKEGEIGKAFTTDTQSIYIQPNFSPPREGGSQGGGANSPKPTQHGGETANDDLPF